MISIVFVSIYSGLVVTGLPKQPTDLPSAARRITFPRGRIDHRGFHRPDPIRSKSVRLAAKIIFRLLQPSAEDRFDASIPPGAVEVENYIDQGTPSRGQFVRHLDPLV